MPPPDETKSPVHRVNGNGARKTPSVKARSFPQVATLRKRAEFVKVVVRVNASGLRTIYAGRAIA